MSFNLKNKTIQNTIAVLALLLVSTIYFYPETQGYSIKQGDIVSSMGMGKEKVGHLARADAGL